MATPQELSQKLEDLAKILSTEAREVGTLVGDPPLPPDPEGDDHWIVSCQTEGGPHSYGFASRSAAMRFAKYIQAQDEVTLTGIRMTEPGWEYAFPHMP